MLHLFVALSFLFINLYACNGGYTVCKRKIHDSHALTSSQTNIPITKHKRLVFSRTKPKAKILKYDPFLSLYLVEDTKGFRYPFVLYKRSAKGLASINTKSIQESRIKEHQIGLNQFGKMYANVSTPSLILTSCCALEGIGTPQGVIEKPYLQHFLHHKKVVYADIGIRVKNAHRKVRVRAINPFMAGNNFQVNDEILRFDKRRVQNASQLMQWILFSKVGSVHQVKIRRKGKLLTLKVKSKKRKGGGYLSDTFLEFLGLSFDKNLHIIKIEAKAKKYGLHLGDRLIEVNEKKISTEEEIVQSISKSKEASELLFERNHFQFFVKVH